MQSLSWYAHRLRSMGPREIAWRLRSAAAAQFDLLRIPLGIVPRLKSTKELRIENFRPGFRCEPTVYAETLDERDTRWDQSLVEAADRVMEDRLSYFNLESQFLGEPIDWQRDWWSDKALPLRLSHLTDYRDFAVAGDCKLVWEPNRHHQLVILARAYRVTGNRNYARKVVDILLDWIAQNPFGYGMNWKSGLELGVRLINWVWALDLIRDADVFTAEEWHKVLHHSYLAMWDTQRRYSQGSSANNHLVGEVAGVYIAARYFSDFPNAARWSEEAAAILEREIFAQSFGDGCTREHAFGYQFFVLQFYSLSLLAAERSASAFSAEFGERLHRMFRFMADICADTGVQPEFGDADDGYVLDLGDQPRQGASPLLAVGAELFADETLAAPSETAWWLFGRGQRPAARKPHRSRAYAESGYFVLRSDSAPRDVRVFFDCAELGFGSIAAHGHADCLSFTMAIDGREIFVDPGTYTYFTYPEWRNYLRTTAAHNTVEVDGVSQSELLGPFIWGQRAAAKLLDWSITEDQVFVAGEHDGYTRLEDPLVHRRTLALNRSTGDIEIIDALSCSAPHKVRLAFHLAPGCRAEIDERGVLIDTGEEQLLLRGSQGSYAVVQASDELMTGWVSSGYHSRSQGTSVFLSTDIGASTEICTQIRFLDATNR